MNVFIVYSHPEQSSFNSALNERVQTILKEKLHEVVVSDLYKMDFEPVASKKDFLLKDKNLTPRFREEQKIAFEQGKLSADIAIEQEKLRWCDLLILQFPLWWFSMPAILKGWVDRVLTPGFAYGKEMFHNHGGLKGKKALILLTTGSSQVDFSTSGINGPIGAVLFPIHHGILHYVGFDVLPPFIVWQPSNLEGKQIISLFDRLETYLFSVESLSPIRFPNLEDLDEKKDLVNQLNWDDLLNQTWEG